jgi:dihydrofolate synthase/folylpolyglutamate synthase
VLPATLADWLARLERLHPKTIELGLDRVRVVASRLDLDLRAPTIVVGGTNGKGSTCAMLDSILRAAGYRTGLYTSPHLLDFNERACIDGTPARDDELVAQFSAVEAARGDVSLTYFEFTTLAILRLFAAAKLDAAVLEIGLGGRLDAVNLVDADAAIVTSVDLDHMEYLGPTREAIGFEKAHIYRPGRPAICSDPQPPDSLVAHAAKIGADFWRFGRDFNYQGDRQQWAYGGRAVRRGGLPYPALRGANQLLNAAGALAALEALQARLPVTQQAVRQGLLTVEIPGRFQVLPGRPAIILDVAHNPHAAAVLAQNLDSMGFFPTMHAVFGMLRDKDITGVVRKLGARIDHWHLAATTGPRGTTAAELAAALRETGVGTGPAQSIREYATMADALRSAQGEAGADDRIVAFGSFLSVADVVRALRERPPR